MPHSSNLSNNSKAQSKEAQSKWIYVRWFLLRFALIVFDILAVNVSVYLALITRFYVAKQFHAVAAQYFEAYARYAPFYTVLCIVIFALFKLYSGIWRYAGFNDLSRIVNANIICFIVHVAGTLLAGIRMPITIYSISAVIQLGLVGASRFTYRIYLNEKDHFVNHSGASVNALLVGAGGTARSVTKQIQRQSVVRPVCMLDYRGEGYGALLDGIPVVNGIENLKTAIDKYHVNLVVLASTVLPRQMRDEICRICLEKNVEVKDYSGFFQKAAADLTLRDLAEYSSGAVELVVNGLHQRYADCEQALISTEGKYIVKTVSAKGNVLVVELADYDMVLNDLDAQWVKDQKEETGEEISFF